MATPNNIGLRQEDLPRSFLTGLALGRAVDVLPGQNRPFFIESTLTYPIITRTLHTKPSNIVAQ